MVQRTAKLYDHEIKLIKQNKQSALIRSRRYFAAGDIFAIDSDIYKVKYDFYGDINRIAEEFHKSLGYDTKQELIDAYRKCFPILKQCRNELPISVFYHAFDKLTFDKKTLIDIGTFSLCSAKIIISDISHAKNTWCAVELKDVVPGTWRAFKKVDGKRTKELIALHTDFANEMQQLYFAQMYGSRDVYMSTGACCIFDELHHAADDKWSAGIRKQLNSRKKNRELFKNGAAVCCASDISGLLHISYNIRNQIIMVIVDFLE